MKMHSAKVFKRLNLVKKVNIWHLRQLGGLEHDGEKAEPAIPHPLDDGLQHWVHNGPLGLGPQAVQLRWHPGEKRIVNRIFLTTLVHHLLSTIPNSEKLWKQKAFHHPFSNKVDPMWGLPWPFKYSHIVWIFATDIFCSGRGADPESVGCSAHGHAHSNTYLKFENFEPWNQRVPWVWIRTVGSLDFPDGVSTLPNFSLSGVWLGDGNRSHIFCWWYFCWQRVFEMVTRVSAGASPSSTDFLRYTCRKTLCMGLQGSWVFLLMHGSLCFVLVRISLITSLMLNPFP